MKSKNILLVYGASTRLAFIDILKSHDIGESVSTRIIEFDHHASWHTRYWFRYILNTLHIIKLVVRILILSLTSKVVIFGTDPCRLLSPFLMHTKAIMIFNELPVLNKYRVLYFYDRCIFNCAYKVYVSSAARANLVKSEYGLRRKIGVLYNIPSIDWQEENYNHTDKKGFIYTGLINANRFGFDNNNKLFTFLSDYEHQVDCFGWKQADLNLNEDLFKYKGIYRNQKFLKN